MPFITVKIGKGRTIEQKRKLARRMTDAMVDVLGVEPGWVTILFEESDKENWATGGELHGDKGKKGPGK